MKFLYTFYIIFFKSTISVLKNVGFRPNRYADHFMRKIFKEPEYDWFKNRWGDELYLTPYYHIDRNIIFWGTYDLNLHLFIDNYLKEGMVCLDIGANLGEVSVHMSGKVGNTGRVYSFEPVERNHSRLRQNIERNYKGNNIETYQIALSNYAGKVKIDFGNEESDNQGIGSIVNLNRDLATTEVQCLTLDEFVEDKGIKKIDFVKMDIEGAEILLLEGGKETFKTLSPDFMIEFSPEDLKQSSRDSTNLAKIITDYGYNMYTVKRGKPLKKITQTDIHPDFSASNIFCSKNNLNVT